MPIHITHRTFRGVNINANDSTMRLFNWMLIVMLTVNVNFVCCASTMGNSTMETTNSSCEVFNITNMLEALKTSCADNEIIYLFIKESRFDVFPHVFEYYSKLQSVDISSAGVQHIDSTTFNQATHLVSLYMGGSNITKLQNNWFVHANNLTVLTISNSSIEIIEQFAFNGLSNLKELDLSSNKIVALHAEIFQPLSRLDNIRLSDNKIQIINNDLFIHNTQLKLAYFNNNQIIVVESNSFMNCRLIALDLGLNMLHELDLTTIKYLKNLIVAGNDLETLKVPSVVEEIKAMNNSISAIESEENNALKKLFLSSNHLIHLQNLVNFKKLEFLDLSSNHFRNFTFSELKTLTQLKELRLCGNKMSEIKADEVATNLPQLKFFELSTLHWSDSYVEQLKSDLANHSIVLNQDRSIISDDDSPITSTKRPSPPVTQRPTSNPIYPTPSPNADIIERKLFEINKKLSDLEYRTGANAAADSKKIDGRLLDIEDKLVKSDAENDAKYEAMRSTLKVYEVLVVIIFVSLSVFLMYKVVLYSRNMFNGMQYRRTQSREPIFSEQDL